MRITMSTTPDPRALELLRLLQGSDSAYPTGAYAHSFGLEGLAQAGVVRDLASLEAYLLEHGVPALAHGDLPFVAHAHAAALRGDAGGIFALDAQCAALRGARELREAGARVGAQRVEMAAALADWPLLRELAAALGDGRWTGQLPVAYGAVSAAQGVAVDAALAAYAYQHLAGAAAASLKLLRVGQVAVQQMLTRVLDAASSRIALSRDVAVDDIGWFSPLVDIASARHETAYTRLFIS